MSQQQDKEIISTEDGKKKIDPKKLEKQLKFEQKQAAQALLKQQQEQKQKKVEKIEKPKKEIEESPIPNLGFEEGLKFKQNLQQMREKYEPTWVESHWQQYWNENKYFHPSSEEAIKAKSENKFIILVPPPNVTGSLHIGHGLTFAIQDTLVRYKRMNGFVAQYTPGTDHAGIATQTVVEKMIWKNEKKTRNDYGREKFLEKVWDWKKIYGDRILMQAQKLGASVDWERIYFTMDKNLTTAVKEAFVRLHEKKLIYRSNRLVNWSCKMRTALSEIEVEYVDVTQPTKFKIPNHSGEYTFGLMQSFSYKVKDSDEEIVIATTRLETMLGDVAVAVNSKDPRYTHLIGKSLIHPFIPERELKIITDDILVDMNFGSGAVKITPGHDPNDFECGVRNNLPQINIFNDDGDINENGGRFKGMKRYDARNTLTEELKKINQYKGEEPNPYRLGFCSRSKDVIEPMMRPQWYVSCKEMSQNLCDKVRNKDIQIIPEEHEKTWYQWCGGIRDWCISRQIWWGHQCPAYQVSFEGEDIMERSDRWIIARNQEEAMQKAILQFNKSEDQIKLTQDQDVLDTWFSSALLPFSVHGWPNEENPDFKAFFPNSILETGVDILFFWVARMVLMSVLLLDQIPFKTVYLHPMIRDAQGRKMSKSLGNVIDPLEIINGCTLQSLIDKIQEGNLPQLEIEKSTKEKQNDFPNGIQECGSDALRFGLLCYLTQNRSINLDLKRIIGYRNFCNKIWQSFKFVTSKFNNFTYDFEKIDFSQINLLNKWILVKLNKTIKIITEGFDNYNLADPANGFHQFWIHDFCDTYIEGTKFIFQDNDKQQIEQTLNVLFCVIEYGLRLLHPMMVFLTEELYQKLPDFKNKAKSICIAEYPKYNQQWVCENTIVDFENIQQIVVKARSMGQSVNLANNVKPQMFIVAKNLELQKQDVVLKGLSKSSEVQYLTSDSSIPKGCIIGSVNDTKIYINVREHIKIDEELSKMNKKICDIEKQIQNQEKKMNIKDYDSKTPEEIKNQNNTKLDQFKNDKIILEKQINDLKNL